MKFSQVLHVLSVIIGFLGIATVVSGVVAGSNLLVFGLTREHLFFCSIILFLMAIWIQLATIHHVMIEKKGKLI